MAGFRDICWQVQYEGTLLELAHSFFGPAIALATRQRVHIWSVGRESLLPASLHFDACRKAGKPLEVLITLIQPDPEVREASASTASVGSALASEIAEGLQWVGSPNEDDVYAGGCELIIRLAAVRVVDPAVYSFTRCVGLLIDEFGNAVEYAADWGEQSGRNGEKRQIAVSWSWGDPSFRVAKGISRTDNLWEGRDPSATTVTGPVGIVEMLRHGLEELVQNPGISIEPELGRALFRHQKEAVDQWMARDCRGVFKMCTGSGKTVAALAGVRVLSEQRYAAGTARPPVVVTVPTRVLADQWIEEIKRFGFPTALAAYNTFDQWSELLEPSLRIPHGEHPRFVVTTYCTFVDERFTMRLKRAAEAGVQAVWIADEMHNLSSHRLRQSMRDDAGLFQFRLGLSATPDIEGDFAATEFLREYFGDVCKTYELRDGIADRVLCPYRYYPVPAYLDPAIGGQYLALLAQIHGPGVDRARLVNLYRLTRQLLRTSGVQLSRFADLLRHLVEAENDLAHTLVYCPPGYGTYGSDISDEIDNDTDELRLIEGVVEILRGNGLSTSSILGETPQAQRKEILKRFAKGSLQTLCSIGCLDEGVDVPSIKRAIVLHSIDREKQFVQRRGRILRNPARDDQKVAEIYDVVLLPQGSSMPTERAEALLARELRRYRTFAGLAMNRDEADRVLTDALAMATRQRRP